jgi:AraC-like DNA-binding protein
VQPLRYVEREPAPPLRRFVRRLWALESPPDAPPPPADLVLPDGCSEAVLHHGDGFERRPAAAGGPTSHRTAFVGQLLGALPLRPLGRVGVVGVRFEPAGAARLLGVRADEATERSLPLDDLPGPAARALVSAVRAAGTLCERLDAAERVLFPAAAACSPREGPAERAAREIARRGGRVRLDDLCRDLGAAGRTLERAFLEEVGMPPKVLARILRFQRALAVLRGRRGRSLADAAHACGYCDQSHLTRDFREFASASPGRWLAAEHVLADAFLS